MTKPTGVHVYSEIDRLKKVLLHRPGKEIDNLTPTNKERLLFDDLPDAYMAGTEHDAFAEALRDSGIETIYIEDLLADVLRDSEIRASFVRQFLIEDAIDEVNIDPMTEWLSDFSDARELADLLIAGIRNFNGAMPLKLPQPPPKEQLMLLDPLPNLYFSRDPFSFIGRGVSLSRMYTNTRQRETLIGEYIFEYHPDFVGIPRYYQRTYPYPLEGGDILVLNNRVLAVGVSERTNIKAIELLAENLLKEDIGFRYILAIKIPSKRAFMHLDTVFTMIDHDIFTIHPEIEGAMEVFEFTRKEGRIKSRLKSGELSEILARYLEVEQVTLIRCGGGDPIDAQREQWSDGSNTLAVAPGKVIVYSRNHVTNRILEEAGIELVRVPSSELSRGRGGPRCMSMPIWRE
ncbi:MAG TPA: arginine deiminase [Clostridiaceae bacterium]|nr:arginine deiminase [Clostridiaceae bacterium]